ncbi:MAG: N-acetylmuramic acid 6-phosphate etherase [Phycisphaerales bacterium]
MDTSPNNPTLPPDRSGVGTESRNPGSERLHTLSSAECVRLINREDRKVIEALDAAADDLAALIDEVVPRFARGGRLIYLGAGTSGRLGVLDASEAPPTFQVDPGRVVGIIAGGDAALRRSSESMEDLANGARAELESLGLTPDDTVIGLAAGGTTPYPRGALAIAKGLAPGCLTAMIVCCPTPGPEGCDHLIVLDTGPEVVTGSTRMKAGTATKLALNTISTTVMVRTGRVYRDLMVDLRATNDKLKDRAARIVGTLTGLDRPAAFVLLDHAGGGVKCAVVMHALNLDREQAEARLAEAGGRLDAILGD